MELRLSDLFFQNSISVRGSGCLSPFSALSGSYFNTFLICLVHVIIAPKNSNLITLFNKKDTYLQECGPCPCLRSSLKMSRRWEAMVREFFPSPIQW